MDGIEVGQVWRWNGDAEVGTADYGDIIRYEVVAVGRRVASLRNRASLAEVALTAEHVADFVAAHTLVTE